MSEAAATKFIQDIASDDDLRKGFVSAGSEGGLASATAFASAKGYDVNEDDLRGIADTLKASQEDGDSSNNELSDEDLEKIAGGSIFGDIASAWDSFVDSAVAFYNKGNNAS